MNAPMHIKLNYFPFSEFKNNEEAKNFNKRFHDCLSSH